MARNKSGKRGSAIIVLMVVAAIAGSPSTAAASTSPRPLVTATAPAPVLAVQTPVFGFENASWAEASWAEEGRRLRARRSRPSLNSSEARNDPITRVMRVFGLVAMVCSLAIAGALMMLSMGNNGPSAPKTKLVKAEATAAVGSLNFTAAATELEGYKAENATY